MIWVYLAYCWELSECALLGMSQPCQESRKASCRWETGKAFLLGQVPRCKAFVWSKYEFMSNWPVCTTSNLSYPFWITAWDFLNTDTFYQKPANVSLCAVPKCFWVLGVVSDTTSEWAQPSCPLLSCGHVSAISLPSYSRQFFNSTLFRLWHTTYKKNLQLNMSCQFSGILFWMKVCIQRFLGF